MAKITLLGRDFDVAPYKIGAMRKAAPFITRINETAGSMTTLEGAVEAAGDMIGFLAIGLSKIDPTLTAEQLEEQIGLNDALDLQKAMIAVIKDSGLQTGEAKAPSALVDAAGA
jgi:hypothetical protein